MKFNRYIDNCCDGEHLLCCGVYSLRPSRHGILLACKPPFDPTTGQKNEVPAPESEAMREVRETANLASDGVEIHARVLESHCDDIQMLKRDSSITGINVALVALSVMFVCWGIAQLVERVDAIEQFVIESRDEMRKRLAN